MNLVESDLCSWEEIVKGKWIILDANVIINIIKYGPEDILEKFKELNTTLCTLQPVFLELNRTDKPIERVKRNNFLNNVEIIRLTSDIIDGSEKIQKDMWIESCYPEPEDLYLAAGIYKLTPNKKTLLATSNLIHFKEPLFRKEGFILLTNQNSVCVISLLTFNRQNKEEVTF